MSEINQKEYLKKYLGIGKKSGEKRKKKKSKIISNGLKIVDDDIDIKLNLEIQEDLAADNDDAPQIVSVIDERPPSLQIDEVTKEKLWSAIWESNTPSNADEKLKLETPIKLSKKSDLSRENKLQNSNSSHKKVNNLDLKFSTSRQGIKNEIEDTSPPRRNKNKIVSSSPPRKARGRSEDPSPPRKSKRTITDISSPRRNQSHESEDYSPPRRIKSEDISPPRRSKGQSEDCSPPRKRNADNDNTSSRIRVNKDNSPLSKDMDNSPPRKKQPKYEESPPRKIKREKSRDSSPKRYSGKDDTSSTSRRKVNDSRIHKTSRWDDIEESEEKLKKTLDGKKAGLQDALNLVLETQALKKREDELFKNMSAQVSGVNAATVVRSRMKNIDWEEEERKRKREEENKEKYDKWGRGLKQVEDVNEKIKNDLYEMSKPLARYADDEDLERYLKSQEREGDPMLAYIRKKRKKKAVEEGKPVTQQYQGDAPPNRFGIWPGYRWDGVDRSNGYEKEWFQVQNSRTASREESYKWSTEDM